MQRESSDMSNAPRVIKAAAFDPQTTPAMMTTARVVSPESGGPSLLFGATWLEAGQSSGLFILGDGTADEKPGGARYGRSDEMFYVVSGTLRAVWNGESREAETGDILHLSPGGPYRLENPSGERMMAIYALVPFAAEAQPAADGGGQ